MAAHVTAGPDHYSITFEPGSVTVSKVGVEKNLTNIEGLANEDSSLNEGRIFYDILFSACYPGAAGARIGMYIIVEAQNAYYKGYPIEMRGVYYAARRLSSQLKSINNETNYGCLQKVYSIFICMGDVPDREAGTASLYRMEKHDIIGNVERGREAYDLLSVIVLRINDRIRTEDGVLSLLQTLCSNVTGKKEKLRRLREYGIRIDDSIEKGVGDLCNLSELIETRGETRGEMRARKQIVLRMLKNGLSCEEAADYADLPVDLIRQWEAEALRT